MTYRQMMVLFFGLVMGQSTVVAESPSNFSSAKKIALRLFHEKPVTLYCQCPYDKDKHVDLNSCGMHQAMGQPRASRIEWEHIMPAQHFGKQFACWREKICTNNRTGAKYRGRKCCEHISSEFRHIESELYNLWPSVGSVNQARSNFHYHTLHNKRGFYGCDIAVDKGNNWVEPSELTKGIVARATLFMIQKYQIKIDESEQALLMAWNQTHPPTDWEIDWASQVADIEGYDNPFITEYRKYRF